jgi:hypothetical protein
MLSLREVAELAWQLKARPAAPTDSSLALIAFQQFGKSSLIISCKNTSAQRASEASMLRDGRRVNLPVCDGTLDQPTHILVSDDTQHSQASFVAQFLGAACIGAAYN